MGQKCSQVTFHHINENTIERVLSRAARGLVVYLMVGHE